MRKYSVLVQNAVLQSDELSSAFGLDIMAFPLKIADWKGLLDDVTHWLRVSLRIQVCP